MKPTLLLIVLLVSSVAVAQKDSKMGEDIIRMMHERHKSNWYPSLCFSQKVFNYRNDSLISTDVWHEAYLTPGNLIIKFTSKDSGNGMLFRNDSLYVFDKGAIKSQTERLHDLIILGFEVNTQKPEITIKQIERMGYNLNIVEKTDINGNPAWLIGDTSKLCFWVDEESLLFVKMRRATTTGIREVEFAEYETIKGFPVATLIKFYNNPGKLNMVEKYFNIKVNCSIDNSVFSPQHFNTATWQ